MMHVRLANYYVLRDLSKTMEDGDTEGAKSLFRKYMDRYRTDSELCPIGCKVCACLGKMNSQTRCEIKARLEKLSTIRRLESLNGSAHLFPNRLASR